MKIYVQMKSDSDAAAQLAPPFLRHWLLLPCRVVGLTTTYTFTYIRYFTSYIKEKLNFCMENVAIVTCQMN